jgi:hypothetical protein
VKAGAPEGNPEQMPPTPSFPAGWRIGEPDMVTAMAEEYTVDATGPDEYMRFTVPTNFTKDRWVQAVELRPGNRKVVHHAHAFIIPPIAPVDASKPKTAGAPSPSKAFFVREGKLQRMRTDAPVINGRLRGATWRTNPRANGRRRAVCSRHSFPARLPNSGLLVSQRKSPQARTSSLTYTIHGRPVRSKKAGRRRYHLRQGSAETGDAALDLSNFLFAIPANASNHEVTACHTVSEDVLFLSYLAHMHSSREGHAVQCYLSGRPL